ncbi:carbohydrate-binding module family 20 domain-containing protein [Natronoglycomyces albus]|uniref:Alpha-amylase n=1 Tax=Natronoglycomyces albus TaxID=2811108 RepID=A0A895XNY7_9ACTN|nr:carbohydrate-binding module family 20 domain-containing protein [Natronoglycomyces albus]QSB04216.1 alpha amylase C-terminal domain-containing protein [Natronoglycomyces albus]
MNHTSTLGRTHWRRAGVVLSSSALAAGLIWTVPASATNDDDPTTEYTSANFATLGEGDSIINMFQWNWNSVAQECQTFLGDSGYTHVQVSPPQDHIAGEHAAEADAWYIHYQPTSYDLNSRLGTASEFASMIATCNSHGIEVIVDAVINHMAAGGPSTRTSWAGHSYRQFDYPAVPFAENDFNSAGEDYCEVEDYSNRWEVQNCHLVGLNDIDTGAEHGRQAIAAYLNHLMDLGAAGFRVDASKHMPATDLEDILSRVQGDPYIVHEVIYHNTSNEPIHPDEYYASGAVHMFDYAAWMRNHFAGGTPANYLLDLGPHWDLAPSHLAGTFISNHDTVRGGDSGTYLNYYDDHREYLLANVYMMAYPYGVPSQMTDYAFNGFADPPPLEENGRVSDVNCEAHSWTCQQRLPEFTEMAKFRAATAGHGVTDQWHNDADAFAFGRGEAGYVVINAEQHPIERTFHTSLAGGEYCDVLTGGLHSGDCAGDTYTVDSQGRFTATVPAGSSLALHVNARGDTSPGNGQGCLDVNVNAETWYGQNIHITGNISELGAWNPHNGPALHTEESVYPVWSEQLSVPSGQQIEYKYVKINPNGDLEWESGANRTTIASGSDCQALHDTWRG